MTNDVLKPPSIVTVPRETIESAIAELRPIAERAPGVDNRRMAIILLRVFESMLGVVLEEQTPLPSRHHQ